MFTPKSMCLNVLHWKIAREPTQAYSLQWNWNFLRLKGCLVLSFPVSTNATYLAKFVHLTCLLKMRLINKSITKSQPPSECKALLLNGKTATAKDIKWNSLKITELRNPADPFDAMTRKYVDSNVLWLSGSHAWRTTWIWAHKALRLS